MNLTQEEVFDNIAAGVNYPWDSWSKYGWENVGWEKMGKLYEENVDQSIAVRPSERKHLEGLGLYILEKLGAGGYGVVYRAKREYYDTVKRQTVTQILACKITSLSSLRKQAFMSVEMVVNKLLYESDVHSLFYHENIVQMESLIHLTDSSIEQTFPIRVCHFMELCEGTLADVMEREMGRLTEPRAARWLNHIGKALQYIHTDFFTAHYDLKPQNILYKSGSQPGIDHYVYKLADFGMSKAYNDYDSMYENNLYGNPRIELYRPSSPPYYAVWDDVCNLGIVFAESLLGLAVNEGEINLRQFIVKEVDKKDNILYRNKMDHQISDLAIALIDRMTDSVQSERPIMSDVLQHPFITQYYKYEPYVEPGFEQQYDEPELEQQFEQLGTEDPEQQYYRRDYPEDEYDYEETEEYAQQLDAPQMGLLGPTSVTGSQWKDVGKIASFTPSFTPSSTLNPNISEFTPKRWS